MQKAVLDSWKTKLPSQIKNPKTKCHRPKPQTNMVPGNQQPPNTKFSGIRYFGILSVEFRPNMEKHLHAATHLII